MACSVVRWIPELPTNPHDEIFSLIIARVDLDSDDVHTFWHLLGLPKTSNEVALVVRPIFVDHCLASVRLHSEPYDADVLYYCHTDLFDCCQWTHEYGLLISVTHRRSVLEPFALNTV